MSFHRVNDCTSTAEIYSPSPARILCVLGMHRSGTSCLTGSLQEAGVFLGDCHTWNPHNLKGNRENQQIVDLNDRVLADNGAAWDSPPSAELDWLPAHMDAARELFSQYAVNSPFGFKDPRTLLVLRGWKQLFPQMQFVGIFRHPMAVAQSLRTRSGMPIEQGLDLWFEYNRHLLRHYREDAFPILCFDEPEAEFQEKLRVVLARLGFSARSWQGEFYDSDLKSAPGESEVALPWQCRRLYRKLRRLAQ